MAVCLRVETAILQRLGGFGNLVQQRLSGERWLGLAGIQRRLQIDTGLQGFNRGGESALICRNSTEAVNQH